MVVGSNPVFRSAVGLIKHTFNNPSKWKKHRKTKHNHNPLNDAIGNAEALLYLKSIGFKINLK